MRGDNDKPKEVENLKAGDSQGSPDGGGANELPRSGNAPDTTYGSNVSGSTVGSLAQGDHARAVTIVHHHHHHGLSYSDTKDLFLLLWKQNSPKLAKAARAETKRRVDEFATTFARVAAEQKITEEQLSAFAEPDVQFMLNQAIQTAARKQGSDVRDLLARLLLRRLQTDEDDLESLAIGEAVIAVAKLAPNQLRILALCYVTLYEKWFSGPVTWEACNEYLEEVVAPFMAVKMSHGDLLHIEYAGCATLPRGPVSPFGVVVARRHVDLFVPERPEMINNNGFVSSVIERQSSILRNLCVLSERVRFYVLSPTTVGFALAATVVEQVTTRRLRWVGWPE